MKDCEKCRKKREARMLMLQQQALKAAEENDCPNKCELENKEENEENK